VITSSTHPATVKPPPLKRTALPPQQMTFRGEILDRQKALAEEARKALLESNETAFTLNGEPFTHLETLRIVEELCQESHQREIQRTRQLILATGLGGLIAFSGVPYLGGLGLLGSVLGGTASFMQGLFASSTKFQIHYTTLTGLSKQGTAPPSEDIQKTLQQLKTVGLLNWHRRGFYTLTPLGKTALRAFKTQDTSPLKKALEAKAEKLLAKVAAEPTPSLLETLQQEQQSETHKNT